MGYVIGIVFIVLFYTIIFGGMASLGINRLLRAFGFRKIIYLFLISTAFALILLSLLIREQFVYFWDFGAYWYYTLDFSNLLFSKPLASISQLYFSINHSDYNSLLCILIAVPLKLFGSSYLSFIVINLFMFYIPNSFIVACGIYKMILRINDKPFNFIWIYCYTLMFPIALFPVLNGYIDIAAMLPLSMSYILIMERNYKRTNILNDVIIGLSLIWIVLLRRYFAYSIIGLSVFALIYWTFESRVVLKSTFGRKCLIIDIAVSTMIPLVVLFTFFRDFVFMSLFNNHIVEYSAYKSFSQFGEIILFIRTFGLISIAFAFLTLILPSRKKFAHVTFAFIVDIIIICLLFYRIQDMGMQHYYIICFPMYYLIFIGMVTIIELSTRGRIVKHVAFFIIAIIVLTNFFISVGFIQSYQSVLWTNEVYQPKIRKDIDSLNKLELYLSNLDLQGYHNVYCIASSGILSDDILRKLNAPDLNLDFNCIAVPCVDLRDGFNVQFFDSDVILATKPTQCHLGKGQELISQLNSIMIGTNTFSDHYSLTQTFILDNNVECLVFKKIRKLDISDIKYIADIFTTLYPSDNSLFKDRFDYYIKNNFGL